MFDQNRVNAPLKSEKDTIDQDIHGSDRNRSENFKNIFSVKTAIKYKVLMCLA